MKIPPWVRRTLAAFAIVLVAAGAAFAIYFSNGQTPSAEALAALQSSATVTVTDAGDLITLMPASPPRAGLVFYPGARVPPAAYAARLRPLAEHGYAVFIVGFPLNLAFFGTNRATGIIASHPEIPKWAVGGHSLGGAFASRFLQRRMDIKGLILYASYPAGDLSQRTDLVAVSIYGTRDGLATVQRIDNARPAMPPQTKYVAISGGIHSFFGDYGSQAGDGTPSISREDAASQIVAATLTAMNEVAQR